MNKMLLLIMQRAINFILIRVNILIFTKVVMWILKMAITMILTMMIMLIMIKMTTSKETTDNKSFPCIVTGNYPYSHSAEIFIEQHYTARMNGQGGTTLELNAYFQGPGMWGYRGNHPKLSVKGGEGEICVLLSKVIHYHHKINI